MGTQGAYQPKTAVSGQYTLLRSLYLRFAAGLLTQGIPQDTPSRTPWTLSRQGKRHTKRARTRARTCGLTVRPTAAR